MLIHLTGPLLSETERRFDSQLTEKLDPPPSGTFLAQRDGVERKKPPYDAVSPEERRHATFHLDKTRVLEADVFVFVPDGRVPDEGGCVQLGIAYCQKELRNKEKLLVGLPPHRRPRGLPGFQAQPHGTRSATVRGGGRASVARRGKRPQSECRKGCGRRTIAGTSEWVPGHCRTSVSTVERV